MGDDSTILITGGCGFIGSHLAEALAAAGHDVRLFDDLSTGSVRNIEGIRGRVELIVGDARRLDQLTAAMRGVGCVFHLAALVSVVESVRRPVDNCQINIAGTVNVLEAARAAGAQRVILASSAAVYGNDPELPKRETMLPAPETPYAAAKLAGEHLLRVAARLYGLATVSLRYFNVYGPRQDPSSPYSGVISRFVDALRRGDTPCVYGDGTQTRDFVFVADVVAANLAAMRLAAADGAVFNIGTGRETSLLELLDTLGTLAGRPAAPRFEPPRTGDVRRSVADIAGARQRLGFEPRWSLAEGLAELWRNPAGPLPPSLPSVALPAKETPHP